MINYHNKAFDGFREWLHKEHKLIIPELMGIVSDFTILHLACTYFEISVVEGDNGWSAARGYSPYLQEMYTSYPTRDGAIRNRLKNMEEL